MNLYARLVAILIIVAAIAGAWWKFDSMLTAADKTGYTRRATEDTAAMLAQSERNRDLQRTAEKRYTVQGEVREKFIIQTVTEIKHEVANLAACRLSDGAIRMLNDSGHCASGDPASACGANQQVRGPG